MLHQLWPSAVFEGDNTFTLEIPKGAHVCFAKAEVKGSEALLLESAPDPQCGTLITPSVPDSEDGWMDSLQTWLVLKFPARRFASKIELQLEADCYVGLNFWAGVTWYQPEPSNEYIFDSSGGSEWSFPKIETDRILLSFHEAPGNPTRPIAWSDLDAKNPVSTLVQRLCLHCTSLPSNLSLRIADQPPFWTRLEPLDKAITTPDFTKQLNEYLDSDQLSVDETVHHVPITIHSDTWGKVELRLDLDYFFVIDQFVDGSNEKALTYSCAGKWVQKEQIELPMDAEVRKATLELSDNFGKERFLDGYGPILEETSYHAVTISAKYLPAQQIVLGQDTDLTGIDLCLARLSDTVRIAIQIRLDNDGEPSEDILRLDEVLLDKSFGEKTQWLCVDLPSPFSLTEECYWLVLGVEEGEAQWQASTRNSGLKPLSYSTDGGENWERYELDSLTPELKLSGLVRLRHLPTRYKLPVALCLQEGLDIGLSAFESLERVEGILDFTRKVQEILLEKRETSLLTLEIQGKATGSLRMSNPRIEYTRKKEPPTPPPPPIPLANSPVIWVDGVGRVYNKRLTSCGVGKIGELADIEPSQIASTVGITERKLWVLKKRAEVALSIELDKTRFLGLRDWSVLDIVSTSSSALSGQTSQPLDIVEKLKNRLRILDAVLDAACLSEINLKDLFVEEGF